MKYFDKLASNTLTGSSSQSFFDADENEIMTGKVFCKIFSGGTFDYSFLFTNIMDCKFADGNRAICDGHPSAEGCKKWTEALYPVF